MSPNSNVPDPSKPGALGVEILERIERFLQSSRASLAPVVQLKHPRQALDELKLGKFLDGNAHDSDAILSLIENYLGAATRVHDPRFMAHQVAVPHPISALGDLVHSVTNNGYGTYEMGPQAAAVELALVDWFLAKIGWSEGGGLLTHGGSLANLTALLGARAQAFPDAWQRGVPPEAVLLAPTVSHYSVERTAGIMGLGTDSVVAIPVDSLGKVIPEQLDSVLARMRKEHRPVLAVVANACATATGLYDPLAEIVEVCRRHQAWLHIDGCHGASALISDKYRHYLKGIEGADSVSWDAHKLLGTSALCAAVLFREEKSVYRSFHQEESYLSGNAAGEELPFLRSLECTKSGLGLRLFLVLASQGVGKIAQDLEYMFQSARQLHSMLEASDDYEVPFAPQTNIVLFRPPVADELIEEIRLDLIQGGGAYLSAANFAGKRWLRACIMNPATDALTLERLLADVIASASVCAKRRCC
jgi:L-2,4-diaminobutyrate decarboxylase